MLLLAAGWLLPGGWLEEAPPAGEREQVLHGSLIAAAPCCGVGEGADLLSGKPIDFLSGKACRSLPTCTFIHSFSFPSSADRQPLLTGHGMAAMWDIFCYVENFCVASLAKTAATLFLLYLGKQSKSGATTQERFARKGSGNIRAADHRKEQQ